MIAIIPARGGSKRIPRKNIRDFLGKPIITRSVDIAFQSGLFQEVMVSTDDQEIAEIAIAAGANVPFLRSVENSGDFAGTVEVILEVLEKYEERGKLYQKGCCIYPTAPLLQVSTLQKALETLNHSEADTVFPVVRYSYPVQRGLRMTSNQNVQMIWPENYSSRSQDLEPVFHDAGQFYWFRTEELRKNRKLFAPHSRAIEVDPMEVQDIDNLSDWQLAEIKYKLLNENKFK